MDSALQIIVPEASPSSDVTQCRTARQLLSSFTAKHIFDPIWYDQDIFPSPTSHSKHEQESGDVYVNIEGKRGQAYI